MSKGMKVFWSTVVLVIVVLFAVLVWPTRYRYERSLKRSAWPLVRIDRFTGSVEYLTDSGWERMDKESEEKRQREYKERPLYY